MEEADWYESWFNSPYWRVLYHQRDEAEAHAFLDRLLEHLKPEESSDIMDLACGSGRHARYLATKGFDVVGVDISDDNIQEASKWENPHLSFFQHDMRKLFRINYFHFIFNFFTSFGYFEHPLDNIRTLKAVNKGLRPGGCFTIDFLNAKKVIANIVTEETKTVKDIDFHLKRRHDNGYIIKEISFTAEGKDYQFAERVEALTLDNFKDLFSKTGFEIKDVFGDYQLGEYDENTSDRLIINAQKA